MGRVADNLTQENLVSRMLLQNAHLHLRINIIVMGYGIQKYAQSYIIYPYTLPRRSTLAAAGRARAAAASLIIGEM